MGQAALWVEDCLSRRPISEDTWREVERAQWLSEADRAKSEPSKRADPTALPLRGVLDRAALESWDPAAHVAIDRWTGGAAERLLFSVLEPHGVDWEPIVLELHLDRLPAHQRAAGIALLLLVLDDLARGDLPLGFATNRGMGDLAVESVTVEAEAAGDLGWLAGAYPVGAGGLVAELPDDGLHRLRAAWHDWIRQAGGAAP